jgi:hypothetical protein
VLETEATVKHRPLVVELSVLIQRIRAKGRVGLTKVEYESVFVLRAKKAAEKERAERPARMRWRRQSR